MEMEPSQWREAWEGGLGVQELEDPLCAEGRTRLPDGPSLEPFARFPSSAHRYIMP